MPDSEAPASLQPYAALAGLRVLFIDDDLRTREAVRDVLRLTGASVRLVASAAEGLLAVDGFKPQVIVCDIAMPTEDGYSFMRKLRAREPSQGGLIPALALSAASADDARSRALASGFQLHLGKPVDIDRLRAAVLELAQMARAPSAA